VGGQSLSTIVNGNGSPFSDMEKGLPKVTRARKSRQELDAIFRGDGSEVGAGAKLRRTVMAQRGRSLLDERVKHPTWGTDDQLSTGIRSQVFDTMRSAPGHEHHVTGAKFEGLAPELTRISPLADDVRFVVGRMAVQRGRPAGRLERLAQRVRARRVDRGGLEGQREPSELVGLALAAEDVSRLRSRRHEHLRRSVAHTDRLLMVSV